jgi:hypothetical protein
MLESSDDNAGGYTLFFSEAENTGSAEWGRPDELLPAVIGD